MIDKETVEKVTRMTVAEVEEFLGEELLTEEDWGLDIESPTSGPTSSNVPPEVSS